jgi:uncharacterized OsmC-like protein
MSNQLGVNVDQLVGTINAIKSDPNIAKFQFRARTEWKDGGHCVTYIQEMIHAGVATTQDRKTAFVMEGDEPPVLLGRNHGCNAVEAVLHALTSCLSVGFIYNAAARGIEIQSLSFDAFGDLDVHAFLGLQEPPQCRPGFSNIRIIVHLSSNAPQDKIDELVAYVKKTSPVFDIISNPTPISISVQK